MTLQECADIIGLTRGGVSMREQSALRKLRRLGAIKALFAAVQE